ncbi:unnamed protein product [Spirodela intermedia]|uniref:Uncharacterized protein n=1 Tax=Spirodela intermedia TaxID=51605 RepID=A0A7I8JTB2_SPIIN|nr:unnamed protein product [Spirodela intermedia]CAA6673344.1 unnamed protein product [Spirodela intermedia]
MGVAIRGQDLENSVVNGQDTDIKGPTSKVEYKDILLTPFLIQTVCNGSRGGFIDYSCNVEARNYTSILGGLPLSIVEVLTTASLIFFPRNASAVSFILLHISLYLLIFKSMRYKATVIIVLKRNSAIKVSY